MFEWKHWLAAWACFGMLLYPAGAVVKSDEPTAAPAAAAPSSESPRPAALDLAYIPASSTAAVVVHPQPLLTGPNAEWMPVEVFTAAGMQQFGIDPVTIREVVIVLAPPQGPAPEPDVGVIVRFSQPYSAESLLKKLPLKETEAGGKKVYEMTRPEKLCVYLPNDHTIVLSPRRTTLLQMLAAKDVDSPLLKLLKTIDCSATFTAIVSLDAMRDLIDQGLAHAPPLPPPLADFLKAPKLTSAVFFRLDLANRPEVNLTLRAVDEPAAKELLRLVEQGLEMGRQTMLGQMMKEMHQQRAAVDDPVQQSFMKYSTRMTKRMVNGMFDMLRPVQAGSDVRMKVAAPADASSPAVSVAVIGILVALLLPAVQAAREAARRAQSANNMKQIGLAMLTHENDHGSYPARAIFDKKGKPLLSWRVTILPYLGEKPLYEQFHLDEPWDSPHNKPLLATLPAVYRNPNRPPDTKTNYLAPVGPGTVFEGKTERKISEITDGTVDTILVVEANEDHAVEWTKPDDLDVNLDKPLAGLGQFRPSGFYTVFCDGSVRLLTNDISPEVLKGSFTIAGGEQVPWDRIDAR